MYNIRTGRLAASILTAALSFVLFAWLGRQRQQESLNAALITAVKNSNANDVEYLLRQGADPSVRDRSMYRETLYQQVSLLFSHPPAEDYPPAIELAVCRPVPQSRIVRALVTKGADVNARYGRMGSALNMLPYYNQKYNCAELLDILLSKGANPDSRGPQETTPLMMVIDQKKPDAINCLLDHNANVTAADWAGRTPLLIACMHHNTASVKLLLDRGAPSSTSGNKRLTRQMIRGIVFNADCINHSPAGVGSSWMHVTTATPLSIAKREGYTDVVALLKAHGAKQ